MTAFFKNGKHHTTNIYRSKFIFIFISLIAAAYPLVAATGIEGKKWVIVIDPGHGGRDPGALGSMSREKDINLAIALKTGEYITSNMPDVKVVYTRKSDVTVDLYDRPKIANENKADLFISIHTNWTSSKNVLGAETFIMGLTKDAQNLEVAMKENSVMMLEEDYSTKYQGFDPKSPESYIMFTLMQNVFLKQSTNLASKIQTQFTERVSRKDRGVKQAGFWVLFNTSMPSVLIETGFISNPVEEKFLISAQGQDYLASAIFRACRDYIAEISSRSIALTDLKRDTAMNTLTASIDAAPSAPVPEEVAFMVQVSSSSARIEIKPANFKGLKEINELSSGKVYKYASGKFSKYEEAARHRKEVVRIYPDAFVIAVVANEIVPLQEALERLKRN
jgi:N-acetylmuramoyl-L-alanine amidase